MSSEELRVKKEDQSPVVHLVPRLRFPEFQATAPWQERKLAGLLTESRIRGTTGDVAKKLTVKLWGKGVLAKEESLQGSSNTQYFRRRAGQFIYSKLDFLNQAFGIVPDALDGFESTVDLPCFDVSRDLVPRFLLEYVKRGEFYGRKSGQADGGRKAKRIQTDTFLSFAIPIPPTRTEQQEIADCLYSVDELIEAETRKLEALKHHKKGLMLQLFPAEGQSVPSLRFSEFQGARAWRSAPIGEIFDTASGGTPDRSKKEYWGGDIPWVSTSLVNFNHIEKTHEFITEEGLKNSSAKIFPPGTILIAMYGQGKTRGQVAILDIAATTNQACAAILPQDGIYPEFVFLSLSNCYEELRAMSNSGGQENLSQSLIRGLSISIPWDTEEQTKIQSCLSRLDELIAEQMDQLKSLTQHKTGLMEQLFPTMTVDEER
jgi:type I restriction enzyme, S subunit